MNERIRKGPATLKVGDMLLNFAYVEHLELLGQREVRLLKDFLKSVRPVLPTALAYANALKKKMKLPRQPEHPSVFIRILSQGYGKDETKQFAVDTMSDGEIFLF